LLAAIIVALGVIMAPEELSDVSASGGESVSIAAPDVLSAAADGADHGSFAISQQIQTAEVNAVSVQVGGGASDYRTGDISTGGGAGYGIQSQTLNTGVGSIGQAAVSIAAGSPNFGAPPK
jgi:hypothetical protein